MNDHAPRLVGPASALAMLVSAHGCDRSIENPVAPDPTPLETTYDLPPGRLSSANVAEAAKEFARRLQVMAETDDLGMVSDVLSKAEESGLIDDRATLDNSQHPRRLLTVDITRVCRGSDPASGVVDAERFGTMTMQLKASEHGLFPVTWGHFDRCVERAADGAVTLDGDYFAAIRAASVPGEVDMLYSFTGGLRSENVSYTGELDFRILADGSTEVRVQSADGDIIVGIDGSGREIARDDVGDWICQLAELRCTNTQTHEVVTP